MIGVQILTGVNIYEFYANAAAFGIGYEFTVGSGVMVHTGVLVSCFYAIMYAVRNDLGKRLFHIRRCLGVMSN